MAKAERPDRTDDAVPLTRRWRSSWRRWIPLLILVAAALAAIGLGLHEQLTPRALAERHETLKALVHDHQLKAIALFMLVYVLVVALSLPVAGILTVLAGFLFGEVLGGVIVVVAATAGASVIFLAARTALGDLMARGSGRTIARMRENFQDNALSYMLFLRLVPAFPFTLVNIAPAFLGVSLRTYVVGTFLGIVPGTFAFAFVGGGLDTILVKAWSHPAFQACLSREAAGEVPKGSCSLGLDFGDFITTELIVAFVLLGVVALIPAIWRIMARKRQSGT